MGCFACTGAVVLLDWGLFEGVLGGGKESRVLSVASLDHVGCHLRVFFLYGTIGLSILVNIILSSRMNE